MIESTQDVSTYYDRNTRRFLAMGHGGSQLAIRRAVWSPQATTRSQAIQFVNSLLLGEIRALNSRRVVDLGCGVGGSMLYLSERHHAHYHGATISEVQVSIGKELIQNREINSRGEGGSQCVIDLFDFCGKEFWQTVGGAVDVVYAIESLIHVEKLDTLFVHLGSAVRPGGRLIICDDVLSAALDPEVGERRRRRWLREFRTGWHAPGLRSPLDVDETARAAGFALLERRDLTPYLELDRPRDIAARVLISLFRWLPPRWAWFSNLLGGNALQLCLKRGVVRYVYAVYEKQSPQ